VTATADTGGGADLPLTGAAIITIVVIAVVLIALGLLLAGRRNRPLT
jgi:LPXTG-motif cell wall-anchored protein